MLRNSIEVAILKSAADKIIKDIDNIRKYFLTGHAFSFYQLLVGPVVQMKLFPDITSLDQDVKDRNASFIEEQLKLIDAFATRANYLSSFFEFYAIVLQIIILNFNTPSYRHLKVFFNHKNLK